MCVIAVSAAGVRQPTKAELLEMWRANPHGAGFMFAQCGRVHYEKGFMTWSDFWSAVSTMHFTKRDSVAYHFRISTQAGVNPAMTHPFPLSADLSEHVRLCGSCDVAIMHNGIIRLTTDKNEKRYSDTSLFVARYMPLVVKDPDSLDNQRVLDVLSILAESKLAIMRGDGRVFTVGRFYEQSSGLLVSNEYYKPLSKFDFYKFA